MKWKDWVEAVEAQIREQGLPENPEIFYIDTHMPSCAEMVDVGMDSNCGLTISSF